MDSLPQELIDKTIDNVPHSSLHSCSLVARRWRGRSQRRVFAFVTFSSERGLVLWCANIPQDPAGIPSYVRSTQFLRIPSWREPALFGRVLKNLTSLTGLWVSEAAIPRPDQLPGSVTFGEFGKAVECLVLLAPRCTVATIASLVLSFPNLQDFLLAGGVLSRPVTALPQAQQRRPLVSLGLNGDDNGVGNALAQCGITSRKLSLAVYDAGLEQLLTRSSEVIVELVLSDQYSSPDESPPAISLPPFPAMTTVNIDFRAGEPFSRLVYILSCIHSAPALTSIVFESEWWPTCGCPPSGLWVDVDEWLVRMEMQAEVKGGLTVIVAQQPEDEPVWSGCFPQFRKAGGEVRIEVTTDDD